MVETKFTPGPWRISRFAETSVETLEDRGICNTGGYQQNFDTDRVFAENLANARLVAAAPDLFEALTIFVLHYPPGINPFLDQAAVKGCKALAKAAGQECV